MKNLVYCLLLCSSVVFADIPKYFGYDWIDPYPNTAMTVYDKVKAIQTSMLYTVLHP